MQQEHSCCHHDSQPWHSTCLRRHPTKHRGLKNKHFLSSLQIREETCVRHRPDRRALLATKPATTSIYLPYVRMPHTHLVFERNYHAKKTRHLLGNWIVHLLLHGKPHRCPARGTSEGQGISTKSKRRCSAGESKRRRQQAQASCRKEQGLMHCDHVTARHSPTVFHGWCRDGGR